MVKENEIVLFETEDKEVKLSVPIQDETFGLTETNWQNYLTGMLRR